MGLPLAAMASCGNVLLANTVSGGDTAARSRTILGLTTGIGFIGAAATDAGFWNTGVIGAAIAEWHSEVAVILALLNLITLRLLLPLKGRLDRIREKERK